MSSDNFIDAKTQLIEAVSLGERAARFKATEWFAFVEDFLFKALDREAITKMKLAKTDEDRLMAQQMFLAAEKPRALLDYLISQGRGAAAELSTLKEDDNNG